MTHFSSSRVCCELKNCTSARNQLYKGNGLGSELVFLTVSIKNPPPGGERRRGEKEKRRRGKKNITRAEAEGRARPNAEAPPVRRRRRCTGEWIFFRYFCLFSLCVANLVYLACRWQWKSAKTMPQVIVELFLGSFWAKIWNLQPILRLGQPYYEYKASKDRLRKKLVLDKFRCTCVLVQISAKKCIQTVAYYHNGYESVHESRIFGILVRFSIIYDQLANTCRCVLVWISQLKTYPKRSLIS